MNCSRSKGCSGFSGTYVLPAFSTPSMAATIITLCSKSSATETLAYVLYTSGSTGQPKGVVQNNRNVLHHIAAYTNALHLHAKDRLSLFASYDFDASANRIRRFA